MQTEIKPPVEKAIDVFRHGSASGWTIHDEQKYLDHAVINHGKFVHQCLPAVDGILILENWLNTYRKRHWDFGGVEALKTKVLQNLAELRARVEQPA